MKKIGRPHKSQVAPGIFLRGKTYWLRYSAGGEQLRVSLETEDASEAVKRAEEMRGRAVVGKKTGRVRGGKTPLDRELEKYTEGKLKGGEFGKSAATGASQAVRHFAASMGITTPEEITTAKLEAYYKKTRKDQSEATAQTYVTRVATFARAQGLRITAPKFTAEKPSREITIAAGRVGELLEKAENPELRFILMAGFRAGLRRAEISMARPAWFDLENGLIRIPAKDPVSGFVPKSKRARTIPLVSEFRDFIRASFPDWKTRAWCIRPEKEMGAWIYRFDFRKMFAAFARKNCPELTPHVMRHSYASHLANGGVGIAQLASWVGDRIATLEKHYLHLKADAEKAEGAFTGESPAKKTDQVHSMMLQFLESQKTDLAGKLKGAELAALEKVFGSMEWQLAKIQAE